MSWQEFVEFTGVREGQLHWIVQVFVVVFVTLVLNYAANRILDRLAVQLAKTKTLWDDVLIDSARRPVGYLIWLLGLSWAAEIVYRESGATIFEVVDSVREVGVVALITWFLIRLIKHVEVVLVSPDKIKKPMDQTTASALGKLLRASVVITSGLVILQTLGFSISGVLAFGGIGGIAVGFAAKDLLSNFFGGLMIYLDRPFSVGEWIRSPEKDIEGTVEHIGWRLTRIRTFDKRPIYVPNSIFANIVVQNPSRMTHRRIHETIGVRYDDGDKVAAIVAAVRDMLIAHPGIDPNQTLMVNFNTFAASSLDFFIYCFTRTTNWAEYHKVKQDVLLKVLGIIEEQGAEIAYPTTTLNIPGSVRVEPPFAQDTSAHFDSVDPQTLISQQEKFA